jgi:lipopolysaccharide biosynthesis protein
MSVRRIEHEVLEAGLPGRARVIAFYLPQFHPVPENDEWWGKGFTEWTNVVKARPLFKGHYQPHLPSDLGFYDLRIPEVRQAQAEMAKYYGVEGFCYWHYWFGNGRKILEKPFNEVLYSGNPDFPFCLGWANGSWTGIWHGAPQKTLIEQIYPSDDDYTAHFYEVLDAFNDPRYLTVKGNKIFLIYNPRELPNARGFTDLWRTLARKEGLQGIHFIAHAVTNNPQEFGCDACVENAPFLFTPATLWQRMHALLSRILICKKLPTIRSYSVFVDHMNSRPLSPSQYPLLIPNWDNTPRSGREGFVLQGSTPRLFKSMLESALVKISQRGNLEDRIVFVKAWNEWAEGNHLEPDSRNGYEYLQTLRDSLLQ